MTPPAFEIIAPPTEGRVHRTRRRVRLGDVDPNGALRLDALARYLQDAGNDDTDDAGVGNGGAWVTRRVVAELEGDRPQYLDDVDLATFCGGYGRLVVERRTDVHHPRGVVRTATVWAYLDAVRMRPAPVPPWFHEIYAPTAQGRTVRGRLTLPEPPAGATVRTMALRVTDFDVLGHVNNAIAWGIVEEELARRGLDADVRRIVLEYPGAIDLGASAVQVTSTYADPAVRVWVGDADGAVKVAAWVELSPRR